MSKKTSAAHEKRFFDRAIKLIDDDDWVDVRKESESFLAKRGGSAIAYFLCSLAAFNENDYITALGLAGKAAEHDSNVREYEEVQAVIHALLGQLKDSLYHAKLAAALPSSPYLEKFHLSKHLPSLAQAFSRVIEEPLLKRAFAAANEGQWAAAEKWFRQHLHLDPAKRDAHLGLAQCLLVQEMTSAAIDSLRAARHILPEDKEIASQLGMALTSIGEFGEGQAVHRWAMSADENDPATHARALADLLHDPEARPESVIPAFQRWGSRFGLKPDGGRPKIKAAAKETLTIGYITGSLRRRWTAPVLAKILAKHDPARFRTVGFGLGALDCQANMIFQKSFQAWHDIKDVDPFTLGSIITAENIDILIFMGGIFAPEHLVAFGRRMAPVQASWFENACGFGLENMDVLFTDRFLVNGEASGSLYAERLAFMEHGSLLASLPLEETAADKVKPEDGNLVFAADAILREINPRTIEMWAHILHQAADAKIILRDHDYLRSKANGERLISVFGDFGLAHRADIIKETNDVAFFSQADICLLPFPAQRPEVAASALAAGIAPVCLAGNGAHQRETASFLFHLGLEKDAIAYSAGDYARLALSFAEDKAKRQAFSGGLRGRLAKSPSLDPAARALDLERILEGLWENVIQGNG